MRLVLRGWSPLFQLPGLAANDQVLGSIPMQSLTADRIRWLQPK
jgi:hypothetical protein